MERRPLLTMGRPQPRAADAHPTQKSGQVSVVAKQSIPGVKAPQQLRLSQESPPAVMLSVLAKPHQHIMAVQPLVHFRFAGPDARLRLHAIAVSGAGE